ncbi:MAG: hypothetical protein WCI75_07325, partial [candidate division NC10 bacterium]
MIADPDLDRAGRHDCRGRLIGEAGDDGFPKAEVERTPYQQLWIEWVGLDDLGYHFADCPDRVHHTIELLRQRARKIFEIV